MADVFVDPAGSNTSPYDTWAKAATTYATGVAGLSAGDRLICANTMSTTETGATLTFPGTRASPNIIISSTVSGATTVTYSAGATVTWNTATAQLGGATNAYHHHHGMSYAIASGLAFDIEIRGRGRFRECDFTVASSGSYVIPVGFSVTEFEGCTFGSISGNEAVSPHSQAIIMTFRGCSISATNKPNYLIAGVNCTVVAESMDLTNCTAGFIKTFTQYAGFGNAGPIMASGIKLPTSGVVVNSMGANPNEGTRLDVTSVGTGDEIYGFEMRASTGTAIDDTAIYRSATYDGTNNYSAKITPTTEGSYSRPFRMQIWEGWAAANPTFTAQLVYDSATNLQDDECWIEIEYPDATDNALRNLDVSSRAASITTTPADLSASSESWTGTGGMTNENADEIAVTISGGAAGVHIVTLCYAPGATTPVLYADPEVDVT